MGCSIEPLLESGGWDQTFLDLSSKTAEPFCSFWHLFRYRLFAPLNPGQFENCDTKTKEVSVRILMVSGAVLSTFLCCLNPLPILGVVVVLGATNKITRAIGFALQKGNYTHIRGKAAEKSLDPADPQVKVMTWNICGVGGGMSLDHGGVVHWRSRVDEIVKKIEQEDADVVVLQEIYDTALSNEIVSQLQARYAHFFTHLGPNVWGSVGGCMVLSKCAVHKFSQTSFTNNDWTLNRGFAALEIKASHQDSAPLLRVLGTHLIHGDEKEDQAKRMVQVAQMVDYVARQTLPLNTVVLGDLNAERGKEGKTLLDPHMDHAYQGSESTGTNRLVAQWDGQPRKVLDEKIDYISLLRAHATAIFAECHLVRAFDPTTYDTKRALSDHNAVVATIRNLRPR